MRLRPEVTTTVADLLPMSNRHGRSPVDTASTPNSGHLPRSYQYLGERSESTTSPRAQGAARGAVTRGLLARGTARWCGARPTDRDGEVPDAAAVACRDPAAVSTSGTPDSVPGPACRNPVPRARTRLASRWPGP